MSYYNGKKILGVVAGGGGGGVTNYNDLTDKPIINADLTADGFTPTANTYYRHTGETTETFINGVVYFYDTKYNAVGVDVQIDGKSIVENGVATIPIATDKLGLVKRGAEYGISVSANGTLNINRANATFINTLSNSRSLYMPIVPINMHYAVKTAIATMLTRKDAVTPSGVSLDAEYSEVLLSNSEQEAAQEWLGVKKFYKHIFNIYSSDGNLAMCITLCLTNSVETALIDTAIDENEKLLALCTILKSVYGDRSSVPNISGYVEDSLASPFRTYPIVNANTTDIENVNIQYIGENEGSTAVTGINLYGDMYACTVREKVIEI